MPSDLHDAIAQLGARWLKRQGFPVVASDLSTIGYRGREDVIGFRSSSSVVIEAKVSRGDFLADQKKARRQPGGAGVGLYRFYICPRDLIRADELPPRWGLLYVDGKRVIEVVKPLGNIWPGPGTTDSNWAPWQNEFDQTAERAILFSIARRLSLVPKDRQPAEPFKFDR